MDMSAKLRKFHIFQDEVKLAHTSHWDLDYLGLAEFDALMNAPAAGPDCGAAESVSGGGDETGPTRAK